MTIFMHLHNQCNNICSAFFSKQNVLVRMSHNSNNARHFEKLACSVKKVPVRHTGVYCHKKHWIFINQFTASCWVTYPVGDGRCQSTVDQTTKPLLGKRPAGLGIYDKILWPEDPSLALITSLSEW